MTAYRPRPGLQDGSRSRARDRAGPVSQPTVSRLGPARRHRAHAHDRQRWSSCSTTASPTYQAGSCSTSTTPRDRREHRHARRGAIAEASATVMGGMIRSASFAARSPRPSAEPPPDRSALLRLALQVQGRGLLWARVLKVRHHGVAAELRALARACHTAEPLQSRSPAILSTPAPRSTARARASATAGIRC